MAVPSSHQPQLLDPNSCPAQTPTAPVGKCAGWMSEGKLPSPLTFTLLWPHGPCLFFSMCSCPRTFALAVPSAWSSLPRRLRGRHLLIPGVSARMSPPQRGPLCSPAPVALYNSLLVTVCSDPVDALSLAGQPMGLCLSLCSLFHCPHTGPRSPSGLRKP